MAASPLASAGWSAGGGAIPEDPIAFLFPVKDLIAFQLSVKDPIAYFFTV
jgi:hypothetical protein